MFKQLGILLCTAFVVLLPGGQSSELHAQGKPSNPLFPTVFLKPGEMQQLVFSTPESRIGARDRTGYDFTPVKETGEKTTAPKGVTINADFQQMGALWDRYGNRFVAVKLSATADAEPGTFLFRVHAAPFVGPPDYETTVRLIVAK